ncbi:hypothetical protein P873_13040 [Arenimonas composti TR7-09 = DSM 18010]|uniref:Uncharacterized protein n=1 Tax=Arenimonas composti TR7-09 = DSM 18010 TaxID=1121013 RepID=A0A091BBJ6_9GAMM|nr:hypothetical protein P873_13040 [Arenimonas composti TR7-09 = DSM 18010]
MRSASMRVTFWMNTVLIEPDASTMGAISVR